MKHHPCGFYPFPLENCNDSKNLLEMAFPLKLKKINYFVKYNLNSFLISFLLAYLISFSKKSTVLGKKKLIIRVG
jgi:hypothetical protein